MTRRLVDRLGWWFIPASLLFWVFLWPLGLLWAVVLLVQRFRSLEHGPAARRERRVARLLRWYPAGWRARYGEEFASLLRATIEDGRGGVGMSVNVAREGLAARLRALEPDPGLAMWCGTLCWILLFPQGIVPLVMLLTEAPARSWFLALYLPSPFSWLTAAAMTVVGLGMLGVAAHTLRRLRVQARRA
jgi:hypothetical protein